MAGGSELLGNKGHRVKNLVNIKDYKKLKQLKKVKSDLKTIIHVYGLMLNALSKFKHYKSVMEVISVIQNNKTLCELYFSKIEKHYAKLEKSEEKNK